MREREITGKVGLSVYVFEVTLHLTKLMCHSDFVKTLM